MAAPKMRTGATATELAARQREISVAEFFEKNRHLLGFDNPTKALLTTIKEAVDNSLDACEEAAILPDVQVRVDRVEGFEDRYRVTVEDNGPGIVKAQIPRIFGQLLYGSKFHSLKQSRGQQGIGISAAGMYGQLTTGEPIHITSRTQARKPALHFRLHIDTVHNRPEVDAEEEVPWEGREHGTSVTLTLQARYVKGRRSVEDYLGSTSLANPHARLRYLPPDRTTNGAPAADGGPDGVVEFPRKAEVLPPEPQEIRPHPHGVELGMLIKMLRSSRTKHLGEFLTTEFCRVGPAVAKEIAERAGFTERTYLGAVDRAGADRLHRAIQETRLKAPPTHCLSPIGEELILRSLEQGIQGEFHTSATRRPSVYRGNPFQVEVGLAWGARQGAPSAAGDEDVDGEVAPGNGAGTPAEAAPITASASPDAAEQPASVMRFANRVPLLYQQSACAISRAVLDTPWRNYGVRQSRGALPVGPLTLLVNISSVWVPFTSESKEAIAHYPEILKELRLGVQECGRRLSRHLRRKHREAAEARKRSYIEKYIPHIGIALQEILGIDDRRRSRVEFSLKEVLERSRKL